MMKSTGKLILFVFALFALAANAYAQSPPEELKQMVEQLQQTPNDNALREKIIRLAAEIKPAPVIPEEANRAFVKGNVFLKEAKDTSGYALAITAYRDALRSAPWWGDAYFNLAIAQESAGKFDEAIVSIGNYMASVQAGSTEAREAQNKIYALEAMKEIAAKRESVEQTNRFSGNWYNSQYSVSININDSSCSIAKSAATGSFADIHAIVEWCTIENDKLRLSVSKDVDGRKSSWAECEFRFEGGKNHLKGKTLSGGTSADTSNIVKDFLCYELQRQE